MVYKVGKKVKQDKKVVRRYLAGIAASLAIVTGAAVPALAVSNDYCGSSANGCAAAATAGAQCGTGAASGAFGAFGPGNDWRGGANGPATGLSNSSVCGNRQGNL